jgi:hypothetical protein
LTERSLNVQDVFGGHLQPSLSRKKKGVVILINSAPPCSQLAFRQPPLVFLADIDASLLERIDQSRIGSNFSHRRHEDGRDFCITGFRTTFAAPQHNDECTSNCLLVSVTASNEPGGSDGGRQPRSRRFQVEVTNPAASLRVPCRLRQSVRLLTTGFGPRRRLSQYWTTLSTDEVTRLEGSVALVDAGMTHPYLRRSPYHNRFLGNCLITGDAWLTERGELAIPASKTGRPELNWNWYVCAPTLDKPLPTTGG